MQRHGKAQLGGTSTDHLDSPEFSEGVEKELNRLQAKREANASKMHAAQTGAPEAAAQGLGPSAMDQAQIKQRGAMNQQADTESDVKAAQAQAQQTPINAPPAPAGPQGSTIPFAVQKGSVGGGGNAQPPASAAPPPTPPDGGSGGPPPDGGEDESDPSTQWPPN
jgi:hypothetical protein